jgi:acyl dehydratase
LLGYDGEILSALSGVDKLRMMAPTYVGDTLWAKGEITKLIDRGNVHADGLVVVKLEAINQRDKTVMACDLRLVCRKVRLKSPVGPGRDK